MSDYPVTPIEQAKMLENILVSACEGPAGDTGMYQHLRAELMQDTTLRALLPEFVRTCRPEALLGLYQRLCAEVGTATRSRS